MKVEKKYKYPDYNPDIIIAESEEEFDTIKAALFHLSSVLPKNMVIFSGSHTKPERIISLADTLWKKLT